jgi:predicted ATPase
VDLHVPLFGNLLSVDFSAKYKPLDVTPERQKQMTYDAMLSILLKRAEQQPVLFIVEDLHWADPSTLELLTKLVDLGPTTKIYALFTYRPDFENPWPGKSHVDVINLMKLKKKDVLEIINTVTHGKELPKEIVEQIIQKTDGVPLFVEELSKSVIESSVVIKQDDRYVLSGNKKQVTIPATLRDSLTARLDRLGTAKDVAQLGSVIGRDFSTTLLQTLLPISDDDLHSELAKLVDAELLYKSAVDQQNYIFKHALIQDAAYESILKKTRHLLHDDIARAILELNPEIENTQPELLAHHYSEARQLDKAIPLWLKAGQIAYSRSTNNEAIAFYRKGLDMLTALPETPEGMQQELMFQLSLGMSLIAIMGYTNPDVEKAFTRARAICEAFGEVPQLFPALWGLWAFYIVRREFDMAHQLGDEMMRMAEQTGDEDLLLEAHTSHGLNFLYSRGDFETARHHFENAVALYTPDKHAAHAAVYLQDPGVVATAHLAWVQWILGDVDDALETRQRVQQLGEELGHPYSLSYALTWSGVFDFFRLHPKETLAMADRVLAVATENIFPNWIADGDMIRGWALARLGKAEEGIEQLQRGIAMWHAIGARLWQTHALGLLVDAYNQNDKIEKGLATVEDALETVDNVKETYYAAELWRLKGELLVKKNEIKEAAKCFITAKEIAVSQKAKMFELRALVQLAALQQKKSGDPAINELEAMLAQMKQGLESEDFKNAQAALKKLRGTA